MADKPRKGPKFKSAGRQDQKATASPVTKRFSKSNNSSRTAKLGNSARPSARGLSRKPGPASGIDPRMLSRLEEEGLLTAEGRKEFGAERPAGSGRGLKLSGGRTPRRPSGATSESGDQRKPMSSEARGQRRPMSGETGGSRKPLKRGRPGVRPGVIPGVRPGSPGAKDSASELVAQRLHKVMAQTGVASRRHSEELIQAGRVMVNGQVVTELGTKVVAGRDVISVDGRALGKPENLIYILLNKPKRYVTTLYDPQGRAKVTDLLGGEVGQRVYPVGRLDYETEGLLLLTNDGDLANGLMHPAKQVKKTYIAKVRGVPGPAKLKALENGIELDDGPTAPAEVKLIEAKGPNAATVSIRIHEGRNRQVRRMFEKIGHEVIYLKRSTLGPLHLKELPVGEWRELTEQELSDLRRAAGLRLPPTQVAVREKVRPQGAGQRGNARPQGKRTATARPSGDDRAGSREDRPAARKGSSQSRPHRGPARAGGKSAPSSQRRLPR